LASTGFSLTKWSASDKEILSNVSIEDRAPALRDIQAKEHSDNPCQKQHTLGLVWNTETDELTMKIPKFFAENQEKLTKRKVVSCNYQVFNPLS